MFMNFLAGAPDMVLGLSVSHQDTATSPTKKRGAVYFLIGAGERDLPRFETV